MSSLFNIIAAPLRRGKADRSQNDDEFKNLA